MKQTIKIKYFTDKIDKLTYIGGKSDWIGKIQSHYVARLTDNSSASQQSKLSYLLDSAESNAMSGFRIKFKKQRAEKSVEHKKFYPERLPI